MHTDMIKSSGVNGKYITREFVAQVLSEQKAPRFYLEWQTARRLINHWYDGILCSNPLLRERQENLVEVFEDIRKKNIHMPIEDVYRLVVEHPAKKFYLTKYHIIEIVYNYRNRKKYGRN